jgi:hypothetical protein
MKVGVYDKVATANKHTHFNLSAPCNAINPPQLTVKTPLKSKCLNLQSTEDYIGVLTYEEIAFQFNIENALNCAMFELVVKRVSDGTIVRTQSPTSPFQMYANSDRYMSTGFKASPDFLKANPAGFTIGLKYGTLISTPVEATFVFKDLSTDTTCRPATTTDTTGEGGSDSMVGVA